jgi:ankyrin repeat protein
VHCHYCVSCVVSKVQKHGRGPRCILWPVVPRPAGGSVSLINFASGERNSNVEILELLLKYGAYPIDKLNVNDKRSGTILHLAVSSDNVDLVRYYVHTYPDLINIPDVDGETPLHRAISSMKQPELDGSNTPEIITALISRGASPNIQNHDFLTPMDLLLEFMKLNDDSALHHRLLHAILSGREHDQVAVDFSVWSCNLSPLLHTAFKLLCLNRQASNNDLCAIFQLLVKAAYPPSILDELDDNGFTVLHLAAKHGHHTAIQCLLAHGASVDLRDRLGRTAFHIAAAHGYALAVEVLSQTCDVKALDFTSSNALHQFFNFRHPEPVNTSLDFLPNRSGNGSVEINSRYQIERPNLKPRQNQSFSPALHESAINSYRSILESFLNTTHTQDPLLDSRLRSLLSTSLYEFFNYHNPEPNSISDHTNRALVLDVLLDKYKCNLDVDAIDGNGYTALGLVAQRGKRLMGMKERVEYKSVVNAVGKLLGYGADVMKVNEQDRGWVTEVGAEFWWSLADMNEGSRAEIEKVRREMMAGFRGGMAGG